MVFTALTYHSFQNLFKTDPVTKHSSDVIYDYLPGFHYILLRNIVVKYVPTYTKVTLKVDAIRKGTHNIYLYRQKKCTGCNLKTTELLKCAFIGICAVIRSNTLFVNIPFQHDNRISLIKYSCSL